MSKTITNLGPVPIYVGNTETSGNAIHPGETMRIPHQFQAGDTVRLHRTGVEAEIIEAKPNDPTHVLCGWIDDSDEYQEAYFAVDNLALVKAAEKAKVKT